MQNKQKSIRVAIVLSELRPGGMERVVVHLANGLVNRGIDTLVICLESPGQFSGLLDDRVHFEALESLSSRDIKAVWRLRRILIAFNPSVINLHDYSSAPYLVAANWFAKRVSVIFTAHGELYEGFELLKARLRFFSKSFAHLTGVSQEIVNCHKEYLNWSGGSGVIRNGVPSVQSDMASRNNARLEFGCCDDDFLFLSIGNPRTEKAYEDLIDAVAILNSYNRCQKNCKVIIAGILNDSEYCRMLKERLVTRNLQGKCEFIGYREDVSRLYCAADAFVLSSHSEGMPMVILEAMMAGVPVVATRVGGIVDAVGDVSLLVDAKKPNSLAEAMSRMMNDTSYKETLEGRGKVHVEREFGLNRMVDEYCACYEKIIGL